MKTCKVELNTEHIEVAELRRNSYKKVRDQLKNLEIPDIIREKIDNMIFEKVNDKIYDLEKKIKNYKKNDVCTCDSDTEFLSIDSKDSAKWARANLLTTPLWHVSLGVAKMPYKIFKEYYMTMSNEFPECIGKFGNVKRVRANWTGLADLKNIEKMEQLEDLSINGNMIESLEPLRNVKNLKRFTMNFNLGKDLYLDLEPLSDIESLEEISVMGSSVQGAYTLSRLTNLKRLNVALSSTDFDDVKGIIINNKNLEFLNFFSRKNPVLHCGDDTFKSLRYKKKKIDKIRECILNDEITLEKRKTRMEVKLEEYISKEQI